MDKRPLGLIESSTLVTEGSGTVLDRTVRDRSSCSINRNGRVIPSSPPPALRRGISLLEVLISIGVVTLGIFGVATLIPVAQFRVQQGLSADRQATLGNQAVAEFRVRNMGAPGTLQQPRWITPAYAASPNPSLLADTVYNKRTGRVLGRGFCIDPFGIGIGLGEGNVGQAATSLSVFPAQAAWNGIGGANNTNAYAIMPRITMRDLSVDPNDPNWLVKSRALVEQRFRLQDDMVFDRPKDVALPPNRQYLVQPSGNLQGTPIGSFTNGSMTWFATVSPLVPNMQPTETTPTNRAVASDEFVLSIVVVKNRSNTGELLRLDEGMARVLVPNAGEIQLNDDGYGAVDDRPNAQVRVANLRIGDWIMLAKQNLTLPGHDGAVYRWTKIIGTDERDGQGGTRSFTIANDDFLPVTSGPSTVAPPVAIFTRGVVAVYERTVRLENSTLWN